jgi:hypothetical protein
VAGRVIEPFPRGVLVANATDTTYYSMAFGVGEARSLAYWMETYGSYPASVAVPATAYLEGSNVMGFHGWTSLVPGGIGPTYGTPEVGVVSDPTALVRVRVVVLGDEAPCLAFRIVARSA